MATLPITAGDDLQVTFVYKINGVPIDFTGYTIQVSLTIDGITTEYDGAPEVTLVPLEGRIDLLIEDAITALWTRDGTYRIKTISPDGIKKTVVRGDIRVRV